MYHRHSHVPGPQFWQLPTCDQSCFLHIPLPQPPVFLWGRSQKPYHFLCPLFVYINGWSGNVYVFLGWFVWKTERIQGSRMGFTHIKGVSDTFPAHEERTLHTQLQEEMHIEPVLCAGAEGCPHVPVGGCCAWVSSLGSRSTQGRGWGPLTQDMTPMKPAVVRGSGQQTMARVPNMAHFLQPSSWECFYIF